MTEGLTRAAKRYATARQRVQQERDALRTEVEVAAAAGTPETELARLAGVDRMTIRAWLGK